MINEFLNPETGAPGGVFYLQFAVRHANAVC